MRDSVISILSQQSTGCGRFDKALLQVANTLGIIYGRYCDNANHKYQKLDTNSGMIDGMTG